jgi:hypothetical protein
MAHSLLCMLLPNNYSSHSAFSAFDHMTARVCPSAPNGQSTHKLLQYTGIKMRGAFPYSFTSLTMTNTEQHAQVTM